MTLAERLNKIIAEQNISKREFATRVGVSENYIYTLTGSTNKHIREHPKVSTHTDSSSDFKVLGS